MVEQQMEAIGPWIKRRKIGQGGNGEVWSCKHKPDGNIAAIKFLKRNKIGSDNYKRLCHEIRLLRDLGQRKGILPLLQSNLPPEDKNPPDVPWLAMPEAHSLKNGFSDETPLEVIVAGLSNVATALSELAEQAIHHRDIKPQNLFIYDNETVIGDFGLATYPGKEALTLEGQKLGPLYYIAPEMLEYQRGVDESRADVYSLAKTLWVLVTGQRYPPPGEQRALEPKVRVASYVRHIKSYLLDKLIQLATGFDPVKRISLADFAKELRAWSEIAPSKMGNFDDQIFELNNRLQTAFVPFLSSDARDKEYTYIFEECKKALIAPLQKLREKMPPVGNINVSLGENLALVGTLGANPCVSCPLEGPAIVLCGPGKTHRPLMFISLGLCDRGEEKTSLMAHHVVKIEQVTEPEIVWSDSRDVILGGSTMKLAIDQLTAGLTANFSKSFQRYTELIERHKDDIE